jgi:hypothetical protein
MKKQWSIIYFIGFFWAQYEGPEGGGGPNPISHLKFWQNPSPGRIFIRNPSPSYWNPSH